MSRPQVSIERLPRRLTSEPRESMNCKSCRKRKIKCTRLRPSCEACKVFQCPCIYDAVPKKRGPKTDVLEALLKRVDGLEKRLQDENNPVSASPVLADGEESSPLKYSPDLQLATDQGHQNGYARQHNFLPRPILDAYFARIHGKPYFVLDESITRQRYQVDQLPLYLSMAIYAITVRYTNGTSSSATQSLEYALQARRMVDVDNPTIENLQTLLLLSQTLFAHGLGKKAYMTFSICVAMVMALELYREVPSQVNLSAPEREMRRRLFWAVYLMDCFTTCGSNRPCLISSQSVALRLPSSPNMEDEMFNPVGPNIRYPRRKDPGAATATTQLIDITRILRLTNQYLAAGGIKADSHFPWHSLSSLSKIRRELDVWATGTQDVFTSIETLFGHPEENTILLLSKLVYHLVYCLLYRPFLPLDLLELRGTGQHQSWQIEATRLCFSHANAIAELVELGHISPVPIEWPALVAYCVCTAGTVHVHGVHYGSSSNSDTHREGEVFSSSAELLTRGMSQLSWLRGYWTGVQHQRHTLQTIYTCHAELMRTLSGSHMHLTPAFHLENFMDRYAGVVIDTCHVRLADKSPMQFGKSHHHQPSTMYQRHTVPATPFSPIISLSPPVFTPPSSTSQHATFSFDTTAVQGSGQGQAITPNTQTQTSSSNPQATTKSAETADNNDSMEKDPFLSLLEQVAENEQDSTGVSEMDEFCLGVDSKPQECAV